MPVGARIEAQPEATLWLHGAQCPGRPVYPVLYRREDRGGSVGGEAGAAGEEVRHNTIFGSQGRMVGSVILSNRFRVQEIGRDCTLGG